MGARWHIQKQLSAQFTDLKLPHFSNLHERISQTALPALHSTCLASLQLNVQL